MNSKLFKVIRNTGHSYDCVDLELLRALTRKLDYREEPDWSRVRWMNAVGLPKPYPIHVPVTPLPESERLQPGFYVDPTGEWVLLAQSCGDHFEHYLARCARTLERLEIRNFQFRQLRLPHLVMLENLVLMDNTLMEEITGMESLRYLRFLRVHGSLSSFTLDLTPFSGLLSLDIDHAGIKGIRLDRQLNRLQYCHLRRTSFADMDFLVHCPYLHGLDLSDVPIQGIPEAVRNIKGLKRLTLTNLQLQELPEWLPELGLNMGRGDIYDIDLSNTTVEGVDMSIFDRSQKMIVAWFQTYQKKEKGKPLNEIKVVFLGDGSTGKSLTVARLLRDGAVPADFDGEATPGIAIEDRSYRLPDGREVRVHFWDFGGQEILHSMHRIFLTDRTLYVVMINARNNTQDDQARYWLHNVSSFAPGCPVLLVLNQIDQNPNASINERNLRKQYPNLRQIVRLSALTFDRDTFNRAFTDQLLAQIADFGSLSTIFPPAWKKIMGQVRGMTGDYIRGDEFYDLCLQSGVESRELCVDLLKWFNAIGVSFCCSGSPRLQDYVVLKPEWITNAIYTILWNKRSDTTNGMVDQNEIFRLLTARGDGSVKSVRSDMTYKLEDVDYVLSITRQFRLSFPIDGAHEFIPMLCDADDLPEADEFLKEPGIIEFRMEYDYLPDNVLHRLMVDMRQDLLPDKVWLTGALLRQKYNHIDALVRSDGDVLTIYIKAADPDHRAHTYLNTMRRALETIHEEMGLKAPRLLVGYSEEGETEYFPYRMLEGARKNGQQLQYSQIFDKMIPIDTILNGTDSRVAARDKKLLRNIARACVQLLSNRNMTGAAEDDRNDVMRDALRNMGYKVFDQTHVGWGGGGVQAGSLDLLICHEDNLPWTNLEAMNLHSASRSQLAYWENHLDRLMDNYNPAGVPTLFLMSYVDCTADRFHRLFGDYAAHMRAYSPSRSEVRHGTLTEVYPLDELYTNLRVTRCTYDRSGTPVTVYHYFLGFTGKP